MMDQVSWERPEVPWSCKNRIRDDIQSNIWRIDFQGWAGVLCVHSVSGKPVSCAKGSIWDLHQASLTQVQLV